MTKLLAVAPVLILLGSCGLAKAIDYSFYVPEHVEFELEGKCYNKRQAYRKIAQRLRWLSKRSAINVYGLSYLQNEH